MRSEPQLIEHIFDLIDRDSTDMGSEDWLEPVDNYRSQARFAAEINMMRRLPTAFCPLAALDQPGSYVARLSAGVPVVVVRGLDNKIRAFRNACRHRGMQLADGTGCTKIFRCTYHGWAYRLDGRLEYVPDEHGFPGLDKSTRGLVPLHSVSVQGGLVFVTQDDPIGEGALEALPDLLAPDQIIFDSHESVSDVNWKLQAEGTLEGYHIKHTHPETFYPYGYDNLNVIETQGPNMRVCFPFRRIEKMRDTPSAERTLGRSVTLVNYVFPNASITRLSDHFTISFAEPESPFRTRYYNYRMTMPTADGRAPTSEAVGHAKKDAAFLSDTGLKEDAKVIRDIQAAIGSGANTHYTFGRFESAIVHLHKNLAANLERLPAS
jgi:phenylpropionate dioxygenase-like ring-hydroxylating dioxygenase large terminal subunit